MLRPSVAERDREAAENLAWRVRDAPQAPVAWPRVTSVVAGFGESGGLSQELAIRIDRALTEAGLRVQPPLKELVSDESHMRGTVCVSARDGAVSALPDEFLEIRRCTPGQPFERLSFEQASELHSEPLWATSTSSRQTLER
jgi:hypothetical protein